MKKLIIYLDAGHGGVDATGKYTTAPGKMYNHASGEFHDGTMFYEGVSNRVFAGLVTAALEARTSALVAATITDALKAALVPVFGVTARSPKQKNFSVLRNTIMPAVLVENLFFDNLQDATLLMREDYQKAFADALADGVAAYGKML